jgi:hypothetical protein
MNWEEQYLEDISYLKGSDSEWGLLFDKMDIISQEKRGWLTKYCDMHRRNEKLAWESNMPQMELPKDLYKYINR